jgi:hypothetical protein
VEIFIYEENMENTPFSHEALTLEGKQELVYTAMSKHYFYYRMHISRFVLERGKVPLNPFMLFDYFLLDSVDRDCIRDANNSTVNRSDQIWVFGPISNGVLTEILLARKSNKPIFYFKIERPHKIIEIEESEVEMEAEVKEYKSLFV